MSLYLSVSKILLILKIVQEHVGSGMQRKKQRQTNMIVLCDGHSQPVKEFEQFHVEGESEYPYMV